MPSHLLRRNLIGLHASRVPHRFTDVIVVGSGIAGLSAALAAAADPALEVLVLAKAAAEESATRYAQGGVAAVVEPSRTGDSLEAHIADTVLTGKGLTDEAVARITVEEGALRMQELVQHGIQFDRNDDGQLHFTLEGGHSFPRILHRGDTTGHEIETFLLEQLGKHPNVTLLSHTFAVDLLTEGGEVHGVVLRRPDGELEGAWARQTILATGGLGRLYRETTNPAVATGDGLAMAFRAGATLEDLEFVQFHPTTLYLAGAERFLITEAVRGEGGVLRDGNGDRFMKRFHPDAELAPRDVVSRGIITVLRERGENKVLLDLAPIPPEKIQARFPRILEILASFGVDILSQPIPVRPSAHYTIGGIRTTLDGRTSLRGLLAAGEVACTRLHGANRLASNSLLEGFVFGQRAGRAAAREASRRPLPSPFSVQLERHSPVQAAATVQLEDLTSSLRSLLWRKVGLERSGPELTRALEQIASWIPYVLEGTYDDPAHWTVQNMLVTSYLVTYAALRREESRGVHYRTDFPECDDEQWCRHQDISRADIESLVATEV